MTPRFLACVTGHYAGLYCSPEGPPLTMTVEWAIQAARWAERAAQEGGSLSEAIHQAFEHPDIVWD